LIEIALEIFALKARRLPPVIILCQIVEAPDLIGKKAAAKRTRTLPSRTKSRPETHSPGCVIRNR
jgi:hypothetical protein